MYTAGGEHVLQDAFHARMKEISRLDRRVLLDWQTFNNK